MLAIVAPGQGSQQPGILENWFQNDSIKDFVNENSTKFGFDYEYFGVKANKDEISQTNITQPLLVITSLISFMSLNLKKQNLKNIIFAGHSVGEIVAYCLSGIITVAEALEISIIRGKSMSSNLIEKNSTTMAAILGNLPQNMSEILITFNLQIANKNSSQQIVVGGIKEDIDKLVEANIPGIKVVKLPVSAAFHTNFMVEPQKIFQNHINKFQFNSPKYMVLSNFDGEEIKTGEEGKFKLINQLTNTVRWDLCQNKFQSLKISGLIELCPGGVLTGISKRQIPEIETFAIKDPSDILAANEFIEKHT